MRKWLIAASCAAMIITGCTSPTSGEWDEAHDPSENITENNDIPMNPSEQEETDDSAEMAIDAEEDQHIPYPDLVSLVRVQMLDGTYLDARGILVTNEPIGYFMYVLPGFRADIDTDSGTLTLTAADNGTQAAIEALPPHTDMQQAADELKNTLMRLDEEMMQITEYMYNDIWADATIYRTYRDDKRITTILKQVHDLPLRITVSEPVDVHELHHIMAMISTIDTQHVETLALAQTSLSYVQQLIDYTYQLQSNILTEYSESADSETDPGTEQSEAAIPEHAPSMLADTERQNSSVNESDPSGQSANRSHAGWATLTLDTFVKSTEDLIAFFETLYTPQAAAQAIDNLGLTLDNGKILARPLHDGNMVLWDQATLQLIKEEDKTRRYLARIPVDNSDEGTYKLQEIELYKSRLGWRLHTPLSPKAELPAMQPDDTEDATQTAHEHTRRTLHKASLR